MSASIGVNFVIVILMVLEYLSRRVSREMACSLQPVLCASALFEAYEVPLILFGMIRRQHSDGNGTVVPGVIEDKGNALSSIL